MNRHRFPLEAVPQVTPLTAKPSLWILIALLATATLAGCLSLEPSGPLATASSTDVERGDPDETSLQDIRVAGADVSTTSGVIVTLLVHTDLAGAADGEPGSPDVLPGTATCDLAVGSGADAGDVLDAGVEAGCVDEWSYDTFDGARFVVSIDNLRAEGLTCLAWPVACQFWEFRVEGDPVQFGIDDYEADDGDTVEFFFHTA